MAAQDRTPKRPELRAAQQLGGIDIFLARRHPFSRRIRRSDECSAASVADQKPCILHGWTGTLELTRLLRSHTC